MSKDACANAVAHEEERVGDLAAPCPCARKPARSNIVKREHGWAGPRKARRLSRMQLVSSMCSHGSMIMQPQPACVGACACMQARVAGLHACTSSVRPRTVTNKIKLCLKRLMRPRPPPLATLQRAHGGCRIRPRQRGCTGGVRWIDTLPVSVRGRGSVGENELKHKYGTCTSGSSAQPLLVWKGKLYMDGLALTGRRRSMASSSPDSHTLHAST